MLVFCSAKVLKQPIYFDIPDEEYQKITELNNSNQQNALIAKYALEHIKKYGYNLGYCSQRSRNVDFNFCISCGIKRGQDTNDWEKCRTENINYNFPVNRKIKTSLEDIKDQKIKEKLVVSTEEKNATSNLHTNAGENK